MNILEAISEQILSIEIQLNASLPICNLDKEIIFYISCSGPNDGYPITAEVNYIYSFDSKKNELIKTDILDSLPKEFQNKFVYREEPSKISVQELREAKKTYYSAYPQLVEFIGGNQSTEVIEQVKKLKEAFDIIVGDSSIRNLYYDLGKDMFDAISNIN